jgi:hypothetical protein
MPTSQFILQGFTSDTHIDALGSLFKLPDIQSILISVAFVTEGGVKQIEALLSPYAAHATVFAGIRNDATSYQAWSDCITSSTGFTRLIPDVAL